MKIHPIKQFDSSACGPAVIKMVTNYFDMDISMRKIKQITHYDKEEGMANEEITKILKSVGLKVREKYKSTWKELQEANKRENVLIVSWMLKGYIGHVSVVEKVSDKDIYLADSIDGRVIRMTKIVFLRLWFDYDDKWYPEKNSDIRLRWMAVASQTNNIIMGR